MDSSIVCLVRSLRITLGENPTKLFKKITAGEDVEIENIADYVIRKHMKQLIMMN